MGINIQRVNDLGVERNKKKALQKETKIQK